MSAYGIDVSHWQGDIDWDKVAADGKEFAIIKASERTRWVDENFFWNREHAKSAGLTVGSYHYFRPGWDNKEQAQHFFDTVGPLEQGDLIPWLNVEDSHAEFRNPGVYNPTKVPGRQVVSDMRQTLAAMDDLFGVKVGIYTGGWYWNTLPNIGKMKRPLWVAYWYRDKMPGNPKLPKGWSDYAIHQYTSRGRVDGIEYDLNGEDDVDLNWTPGPLTALQYNKVSTDKNVSGQLSRIRTAVTEIEEILA